MTATPRGSTVDADSANARPRGLLALAARGQIMAPSDGGPRLVLPDIGAMLVWRARPLAHPARAHRQSPLVARPGRRARPSGRPLVHATVALLIVAGLVGCSPTPTPTPTPTPSPTATAPVTVSPPEPTQSISPSPSPTPPELEPAPEGLEPLVAGHNRVSADRINLVLAPWGWDDLEKFRTVASAFVGWSGHAQVWGKDGLPLGAGLDPSRAGSADLGLFGIEPFRSHRDAMNVWVTTQSPDQPFDWFEKATSPVWAPDQVIVVLALQGKDGAPSISISGQDAQFTDPENVVRGSDQMFANATVVVFPEYPAATIVHLPHELGHAMFGFADEYVGRVDGYDGTVRNAFWPSCADSQERAEVWWSDHLGEYDDQLDYWAREMTAVGFGPTQEQLALMREQNTTAYVAGGCFEVPGSVRSAEDTMMGFNFPAYGVTNRLWAERVLELWSGK